MKIALPTVTPLPPPPALSATATTEATRAKQANPAKSVKAAQPEAKGADFGRAVAEFAQARNEARRAEKRGAVTPPPVTEPTPTTEPATTTEPTAASEPGETVDVTV